MSAPSTAVGACMLAPHGRLPDVEMERVDVSVCFAWTTDESVKNSWEN